MNRFQITADVDVTLWLGVLTKYKRQSNKIEYTNLEELFESENVYFPTRDELKNQLRTVTKNLEYEFLAYLRELTDKSLFKIDNAAVYLPLSDEAGTNDIIVFKNGCVWVSRHFRAYVVGQNPKLSKEELNKKIEQELLKHFDKEVAGISPEFIHTTVVPGLDVR